MAHITKYKAGSAWHLIAHDNRTNTQNKENIEHSKSYMNYNLCDVKNESEYLQQLIEMSKKSGVLVSVVITLPEDFPNNEEMEKQFFKAGLELIENDFGKENIVSAWVHYDECLKNENKANKPHVHIKFAPIREKIKTYKDGSNKTIKQFDAKHCITLDYLKKFHKRLEIHIEDWIGFKPSVLNGATKDGNKTIKELKAISEQQRKARTEIENDQKLQEAERKQILDQMWKKYQEQSKEYWSTYKSLKSEIENNIWTLKKGMEGAEKELERNLNIFYNLTRGIFYTLLKLLSAVFVYCRKKMLEKQLEAVEAKFEALEGARRSISNYQHNAKTKLKEGDFEGIVQAMENWEKAVVNANTVIRDEMIEREICKPKEKEIDKVL